MRRDTLAIKQELGELLGNKRQIYWTALGNFIKGTMSKTDLELVAKTLSPSASIQVKLFISQTS